MNLFIRSRHPYNFTANFCCCISDLSLDETIWCLLWTNNRLTFYKHVNKVINTYSEREIALMETLDELNVLFFLCIPLKPERSFNGLVNTFKYISAECHFFYLLSAICLYTLMQHTKISCNFCQDSILKILKKLQKRWISKNDNENGSLCQSFW